MSDADALAALEPRRAQENIGPSLRYLGGMNDPDRLPSDFLNRGGLRRRGWSPSLVRDLLGPPDALVPNPRNPAWPPMPLFARERVEAAEQGARFRSAYARLQARVRAGRAGGAAHA